MQISLDHIKGFPMVGYMWGSIYIYMDTEGIQIGLTNEFPRDPSIQLTPTLGPKVCKSYLHWAIWIAKP